MPSPHSPDKQRIVVRAPDGTHMQRVRFVFLCLKSDTQLAAANACTGYENVELVSERELQACGVRL